MNEPHIVVVGSANMDLTTFTDRFPRPGETIFGREFHLGFGGKGANQAVAARLCGARVSMVGRVGNDLFGPATIRNFQEHGIEAANVRITPGVSSGVAPIFVDSSGQNRILVVRAPTTNCYPRTSTRSQACYAAPIASCCNWRSRWKPCGTRCGSRARWANAPS